MSNPWLWNNIRQQLDLFIHYSAVSDRWDELDSYNLDRLTVLIPRIR